MSKCEEGISLVELVHEQHEEIVILKAERDRHRGAGPDYTCEGTAGQGLHLGGVSCYTGGIKGGEGVSYTALHTKYTMVTRLGDIDE